MADTDSGTKSKDDVYHERNLLACAFLRALDSHAFRDFNMGWWPDTDDVNGERWAVVWAELPQGRVGWHIPFEMVPEWLPRKDPEYDGYSTEEKNLRVKEYTTKVFG